VGEQAALVKRTHFPALVRVARGLHGGGGGVSVAADDAAAAQLKPDRFELREEKKLLIRIEFAA
jgi:hypothetical protein